MTIINNPFVTSGYIAPEYFCDREKETEDLVRWLVNENNVALISTRRMGKTGLIQHCFQLTEIKRDYYAFLIDIYATKTLREFVFQLGKSILTVLKPKGRKAWELFIDSMTSLKAVQSALKGLLEKDFVTKEGAYYMVYDRFFSLWLKRNF